LKTTNPIAPAVSQVIPHFSNHLPVKVHFGDGVAQKLSELTQVEEAGRALVLIDDGLAASSPPVMAALELLDSSATRVTHRTKAPGEPTASDVDVTTTMLHDTGAEMIIAIGGGSVIDTAKAARLCHATGLTFSEWSSSTRTFPLPMTALVAVPTTAGTGSEVSGGAVITEASTGIKAGIAHPTLRPTYAVVDPELTYSVPPALTSYTGVDALAQAIAGMVARTRTPIGDALALEAIRLIGSSLVSAYRDGGNRIARSEMACASLLAGLTMNISDCSAEHSLAQALGGMFGAPHGLTVGLVLAETLEREERYAASQLERVAHALSPRSRTEPTAQDAVRAVRQLLADLDFPVLASLKVTSGHLPDLTKRAAADFFITQAPHPWTEDEISEAFRSALRLEDR
jgi:choline dehydrogenase